MQVKQIYSKLLMSRSERCHEQQDALKGSVNALRTFLAAMQSASSDAALLNLSGWCDKFAGQVGSASTAKVSSQQATLTLFKRIFASIQKCLHKKV